MIIKVKNVLGYLNNFSEMRKAKIENTLKKLYSLDGITMYSYEFVINRILDNHKPEKVENYSYYSSRIDGYTKPKTLYKLQDDEGCYNEINKTQYDFALWLIENNLTTKESIRDFEQKEMNRIEKIKHDEELKQQKEKEEQEKEKEGQQQLENKLNKMCYEYNDINKLNLAKSIHESLGNYYERSARITLVLIDNFDNEDFKEMLISNLHLHNKASRKLFECATGIKLPKTYKETIELLNSISSNDFVGMKEYKQRKLKEIQLNKFYKRISPTDKIILEGEKIIYNGLTLFLIKEKDIYTFYELRSGLSLMHGLNTKKESIKLLKEKMTEVNTEKIKSQIEKAIIKYGEELKEII